MIIYCSPARRPTVGREDRGKCARRSATARNLTLFAHLKPNLARPIAAHSVRRVSAHGAVDCGRYLVERCRLPRGVKVSRSFPRCGISGSIANLMFRPPPNAASLPTPTASTKQPCCSLPGTRRKTGLRRQVLEALRCVWVFDISHWQPNQKLHPSRIISWKALLYL